MHLPTGDLLGPFEWTTVVRLLAATVLGAIIGFERERSGKVAGLRTHALVSLGSALFTVVSLLLFAELPSINGVTGYDYHIVANIIVGIGFIGAGAILRTGDHITGTTTAASLWLVAAVGIAAGFGFYKAAIAATLLGYAVLALLWLLEKRIRSSVHYRVEHPENRTAHE